MNEEKNAKKLNSNILKWVIIGLAGFAVVVLIFGAGILVGGMKARFSYRWAESYHKNFAGPRGGFFGNWRVPLPPPGDFIEGHGTFGEIIQVNGPSAGLGQVSDFVVKGQGNVEKVIIVNEDTVIQKGRETVKKEELKVGNYIVVIGSPNEQGRIEAKLIRVFDGEDKKGLQGRPPFPPLR